MNLQGVTSEQLISLNCSYQSKDEAIRALIEKLYKEKKIQSKEDFYQAVKERERLSATGIDRGIAIPHALSGRKEYRTGYGAGRRGDFKRRGDGFYCPELLPDPVRPAPSD